MFSFLPIGPLLGTRYDVLEKIRVVKTPLLELHGDRDEVVPFDQGKLVSLRHRNRRNLSRSLARATTIPIWSPATGILNN